MNEFICDCGDQHRDNPFCYDRHLKYNRVIRGDRGVIEAAVIEGVITQADADSMSASVKLFQGGNLPIHRRLYQVYSDRLSVAVSRLREIGYSI